MVCGFFAIYFRVVVVCDGMSRLPRLRFHFHLLVALLSQFGLCTMLHAIVAADPHSDCIGLHDLGVQYDAGAVSLCACACICISG